MISDLLICSLSEADKEAAYQVFEVAIPDAFEREGIGDLKEFIQEEILYKKSMIDASLEQPQSDIFFLTAKIGDKVIGTISFAHCDKDMEKCFDGEIGVIGELGSLYVLPDYQDQGIGSALINALAVELHNQGIKQFCLESGYKRAQERWTRKFGVPYKVLKDYWGLGADNMIWLCKVVDYL
jgi:GNAT superfamily N-acetyltransferase